MSNFTIKLLLEGAERAKQAMAGVANEAKRANNQTKPVNARLPETTKGVKSLGGELKGLANSWIGTAAAVGLFVAGARDAYKGAMSLEEGLQNVSTLLGDQSERLIPKYRQGILDISSEYGIAVENFNEPLYNLISRGVDAENVLAVLERASRLSITGVADLGEAVDATTTVLNAFNMDVNETDRVMAVLQKGTKDGATTVGEMGRFLFQAAPAASALGVSIEQVVAANATLTKSGTPTSIAMVQIRAALMELSKSGTSASTAFKEAAGVGFKEFIEQGGSLQEAMVILQEHADKTGVGVNDLFANVRGGMAALGLAGKNAEGAAADLESMKDAAGEVEKAMEAAEQNPAFKMKQAKETFRNLWVFLMGKLLPVLAGLASGVVKVFKTIGVAFEAGFRQLFNLKQAIVDFWGYLTGSAKKTFSAVRKALKGDLKGAVEDLKSVGEDFKNTTGDIMDREKDVQKTALGDIKDIWGQSGKDMLFELGGGMQDGEQDLLDITGEIGANAGEEAGKSFLEKFEEKLSEKEKLRGLAEKYFSEVFGNPENINVEESFGKLMSHIASIPVTAEEEAALIDIVQERLDIVADVAKEKLPDVWSEAFGGGMPVSEEMEGLDLDLASELDVSGWDYFQTHAIQSMKAIGEAAPGILNPIADLTAQLSAKTIANKEREIEAVRALGLAEEEERKRIEKINSEYAEKERKIAMAQRAIKIAQAISNTALAITNALAKGGPPPLNIIQAGLAGATGAAQVATIAAQPYYFGGILPAGQPGYFEGQRDELVTPLKGAGSFEAIAKTYLVPDILRELNEQRRGYAGRNEIVNVTNNNYNAPVLNSDAAAVDQWQRRGAKANADRLKKMREVF